MTMHSSRSGRSALWALAVLQVHRARSGLGPCRCEDASGQARDGSLGDLLGGDEGVALQLVGLQGDRCQEFVAEMAAVEQVQDLVALGVVRGPVDGE
jgi:hypothetical protein